MGAGNRETIYVLDKGKEYACKIVDRNEKGQQIKVHFVGWNKKCDIWLDEDSERIVPSPNDSFVRESESLIDKRLEELESGAGVASKRKRVVDVDEERSAPKRRSSTAQEAPFPVVASAPSFLQEAPLAGLWQSGM